MVTIYAATNVWATVEGGVVLAFPAGVWPVVGVTNVATLAVTNTVNLRDGAVISVDSVGALDVVNGPDVVAYGLAGFAAAISSVAAVRGIRWVMGRMASRMGAGGVE